VLLWLTDNPAEDLLKAFGYIQPCRHRKAQALKATLQDPFLPFGKLSHDIYAPQLLNHDRRGTLSWGDFLKDKTIYLLSGAVYDRKIPVKTGDRVRFMGLNHFN